MQERHHVVILGGGFGGLCAAQSLKNADVQVTLIDRRNFHLFQPLLYQVATGWLSPANIASTLRAVLKRQKNAQVFLAEAIDIDVEKREVILSDSRVAYDCLIVATGSQHHYFGEDQWEDLAPGLKTIEDALEIRRRIFSAFEAAERSSDVETVHAYLTFVIVGGGPTGVELAGALGEIANETLKDNFRNIDPTKTQILLLEAADRILSIYPSDLSKRAESFLGQLGVSVQCNTVVSAVEQGAVTIKRNNQLERISCQTVVWAAGVKASALGHVLANRTSAQLDRGGRVLVNPDLTVVNHPEIFVIGDLANHGHEAGQPLPGIAPVAMQQGQYVAQALLRRIKNQSIAPFHYKDRGNMAIIGRAKAIADFGKFQLHGFPAWLAWLLIHLVFLIEFQNKILVLIQWGWNYFRRNRAARLITGDSKLL